jgi:hypothetical protein
LKTFNGTNLVERAWNRGYTQTLKAYNEMGNQAARDVARGFAGEALTRYSVPHSG